MNNITVSITMVVVLATTSALFWSRILKRRVEARAEASIAAALTSGILYLLIAYISEGTLGSLWPVVLIVVTLIAGCLAFATLSVVRKQQSSRNTIDV